MFTFSKELTEIEKLVLKEYLSSKTYKQIALAVTKALGETVTLHTVDNALLRIRKKVVAWKNVVQRRIKFV